MNTRLPPRYKGPATGLNGYEHGCRYLGIVYVPDDPTKGLYWICEKCGSGGML